MLARKKRWLLSPVLVRVAVGAGNVFANVTAASGRSSCDGLMYDP